MKQRVYFLLKKMEKKAEKKAVMKVKQEVQRLSILIEESLKNKEEDNDDEFMMWLVDSGIDTVRALKELKEIGSDGGLKKLGGLGFLQTPPKEFICPISGLLMADPVVPTCGVSYERSRISKWLLEVNKKWPGTDQKLVDDSSIPNIAVKTQILKWCANPFFNAQEEEDEKEEEEEDDDDDGAEKFYGLKLSQDEAEPPHQLLCPISGNLMQNPVLAASGQTFDEPYIAKWVEEGNTKCPKTDQLLSHTRLIPNLSIKAIIRKWRSRLAPVQPDEAEGGRGNEADRDHLIDTLVKLPSLTTPSDQLPLLKDLRLLTARLPSFRVLFPGIDGAASKLLNPFLINVYKSDAQVYNEVVATLMNISSVEDSSKAKIVQDCPSLIPFLLDAVRFQVSIETRGYAAAALGQLASDDSNSLVIGNSDVFILLRELLEEGDPVASGEAAYAVLRLCSNQENKTRLIIAGLVEPLVEKLDDPSLVPVVLEILALIFSIPITVGTLADESVASQLFRIMEETKSRRDEENCVAVIYGVWRGRAREPEKVKEWARIVYRVSNEGTGRARWEAKQLLPMLKLKGKALLK